MNAFLVCMVSLPGMGFAADGLTSFSAPKFGIRAEIPSDWKVVVRERDERVFVAMIAQADPEKPGVAACELGLAPENLSEYRTRIDANAERGNRPGTLAMNEVVKSPNGERLESIWEFRPRPGVLWREVSIRIIANRQLYTFILNVDDATYQRARPLFDAMIDSVVFSTPNSGADQVDKTKNRWTQREFKFAIDLPEEWRPALAPDEVALLYANGPAHGIWSDNMLVIAQPKRNVDLRELARTFPDQLRAAEPACEVLSCDVIKQAGRDALETVVRTKRGPFSMTILERRFTGDRFDYEVKYTVETKRFDALAPALRTSLESFKEIPGDVPGAAGKSA